MVGSLLWWCLLLVAPYAAPALAQSQPISRLEDRSRASPASYYNYVDPGQEPIRVNVWGAVRDPGLYAVPSDTYLSTLLSLAGGPAIAPRDQGEHREIVLRLSRMTESGREVVYETVMQDEVLPDVEDPLLREGDTLTIDVTRRQGFSWRDALPVVSTVASVAIAVAYFTRD